LNALIRCAGIVMRFLDAWRLGKGGARELRDQPQVPFAERLRECAPLPQPRTGVFVLTSSFNIYLTRPVTEGVLLASGRVVHRSRSLILAESELVDGEQRQVARRSGSFMRSTVALTAAVGYV
jgi:thioesterase superfamily protein